MLQAVKSKRIREQTDEALIEALRQGDTAAAETLTERYYQKVYHTCLRYLSEDDSWDIAQEIFLKIIVQKRILKFRGQSQLWTWLFRITVNACKTWLARQSRMVLTDHEADWPESSEAWQAAPIPDPEQVFQDAREQERLNNLLAEMPEPYRRVLRLVYWEDHTYKQAADVLKIKAQYLGVLVIRGKLWLSKRRRALRPEWRN